MKAKAKYLSVATATLFIGMSALTSFAGPSTGAYAPLQTAKQVQHDCPACGGKLRFTGSTPGKSSGSPTEYVHTCSHCGNVSAYVCASH